jgi:hypothetical protein
VFFVALLLWAPRSSRLAGWAPRAPTGHGLTRIRTNLNAVSQLYAGDRNGSSEARTAPTWPVMSARLRSDPLTRRARNAVRVLEADFWGVMGCTSATSELSGPLDLRCPEDGEVSSE